MIITFYINDISTYSGCLHEIQSCGLIIHESCKTMFFFMEYEKIN